MNHEVDMDFITPLPQNYCSAMVCIFVFCTDNEYDALLLVPSRCRTGHNCATLLLPEFHPVCSFSELLLIAPPCVSSSRAVTATSGGEVVLSLSGARSLVRL